MTDAEDLISHAPAPEAEAPEEATEPEPEVVAVIHCRWCGVQIEGPEDAEDWLCDNCGRYQDAITCPTCNQLTRVSLLDPELVPEPHAPARRRKAKEG